jgi:diacylglycerol kinase
MKPEKKVFHPPKQTSEISDFANKNPVESSLRALDGLKAYARLSRRNWLYQIIISVGIIGASLWMQLEAVRFVLVLLCIALVLAIEMVNTALELLLNWLQPEYDARVKTIKDLAAGAVLVVCLVSVSAGLLLFWASFAGAATEHVALRIIGSVLIGLLGFVTLKSGRTKG